MIAVLAIFAALGVARALWNEYATQCRLARMAQDYRGRRP